MVEIDEKNINTVRLSIALLLWIFMWRGIRFNSPVITRVGGGINSIGFVLVSGDGGGGDSYKSGLPDILRGLPTF